MSISRKQVIIHQLVQEKLLDFLFFVATQLKCMKLIDSIKKTPIAFDPVLGTALSDDWAATGELAEVLKGIGGCSPFLNEILRQEQVWISEAILSQNPLKNIIHNDLGTHPGQTLRQAKRRVAGYLALAELSGAYALSETTHHLTCLLYTSPSPRD